MINDSLTERMIHKCDLEEVSWLIKMALLETLMIKKPYESIIIKHINIPLPRYNYMKNKLLILYLDGL